nr:PREDICTED: elastin-like [Equus przewalskii]
MVWGLGSSVCSEPLPPVCWSELGLQAGPGSGDVQALAEAQASLCLRAGMGVSGQVPARWCGDGGPGTGSGAMVRGWGSRDRFRRDGAGMGVPGQVPARWCGDGGPGTGSGAMVRGWGSRDRFRRDGAGMGVPGQVPARWCGDGGPGTGSGAMVRG